MSEKRWTPGPWFAVNNGTADEPMMMVKAARIAGRPPKHEVAIVATGDSPQEMETANAHLIAAAPALFEALEAARDTIDDCASLPVERAVLAQIDAALSLAKGGDRG